jgi:hypothetical protein
MLEALINEIFSKTRWTWKIGALNLIPDEDDIQRALDEAARQLYNEEVGTRLEVGGLIIEKRPRGHDVYVMVGSYE